MASPGIGSHLPTLFELDQILIFPKYTLKRVKKG
jgi:hypothetical protein